MRHINFEELRKTGRPLWMTHYGVESFADFLGGGGDIWTDRLYGEWERNYGEEVSEELANSEVVNGSEVRFENLRREGRPLWMTHYGVESVADFVGGGGDIWADRIYAEWERAYGEEVN